MKKYLSEFLGTLVLVLFACGTAAVSGAKLLAPGAEATLPALAGLGVTPAYLLTALALACHVAWPSSAYLRLPHHPAVSSGC